MATPMLHAGAIGGEGFIEARCWCGASIEPAYGSPTNCGHQQDWRHGQDDVQRIRRALVVLLMASRGAGGGVVCTCRCDGSGTRLVVPFKTAQLEEAPSAAATLSWME